MYGCPRFAPPLVRDPHFAVDLAFAVPLIRVPAYTMRLLGWTTVEPVATRLVGAALAAIGLQSLLGHVLLR